MGHWKFQEGGGSQKPTFFEGMYEPKLEFPEGGVGSQIINPLMRGINKKLFPGITHSNNIQWNLDLTKSLGTG